MRLARGIVASRPYIPVTGIVARLLIRAVYCRWATLTHEILMPSSRCCMQYGCFPPKLRLRDRRSSEIAGMHALKICRPTWRCVFCSHWNMLFLEWYRRKGMVEQPATKAAGLESFKFCIKNACIWAWRCSETLFAVGQHVHKSLLSWFTCSNCGREANRSCCSVLSTVVCFWKFCRAFEGPQRASDIARGSEKIR